jgi:hypothetical protein
MKSHGVRRNLRHNIRLFDLALLAVIVGPLDTSNCNLRRKGSLFSHLLNTLYIYSRS